jgi:sarcosine oxidase/L-pipecolate oxidase
MSYLLNQPLSNQLEGLNIQKIDSSRIIRPDYASAPYAALASAAQSHWRTTYRAHYKENGLCITASGPEEAYVASSLTNVQALNSCRIQVLNTEEEIKNVAKVANATGKSGYINWTSGWANAEGAMRQMRQDLESLNRVSFITGNVTHLLIDHTTSTVTGVALTTSNSNPNSLTAALTILATGAWTPSLLDTRGIARATGQVLCYLRLTPSEQKNLENNPTLINYTTGMFLLPPPSSTNILKLARHAHGYTNPTTIPHPEHPESKERITVSLPDTTTPVPAEGQKACRHFLAQLHPSLATPERPFTRTRICWYTDTPRGDFLISYHSKYKGLFVATGGSGHGFKFLPIIGDKIVECVMGRTPEEFRGLWEWPAERLEEGEWEGDGSRGGPTGMVLSEELGKGESRL